MPHSNLNAHEHRELAFYYPGHLWYSGDWVKNLLLFFDGIALLVPSYKMNEAEILDPVIASPLADRGLLHKLEAEEIVDRHATEELSGAMQRVIASGALDKLAHTEVFHELSYSRLGGYGAPELADALLKELKKKNLARDTKDGVSIPMHPLVRALVLVLLSQILRSNGAKRGLDLSPATDRPQLVEALADLLVVTKTVPSSGSVVSLDLETVGVDLSNIPLDEVLGYRKDHLEEHRAYARTVRQAVRELSLLPENERESALQDRQEEIRDLANDLKTASRQAWRKPASFALGLAGAAWTLKTGDPVGAIFGAAGAVLTAEWGSEAPNAYSYLFNAARTLRY
jgi:hypothetical protein